MRVNVAVMGYVTDADDRLLVIRRDDTRTWAPPAGSLQFGESPEAGVVREVLEETGVRVQPRGLASVELRLRRPDPLLVLTYRCITLGGELRRSPESLDVAFAARSDLPVPMLATHRRELALAASAVHGPPPYLVTSMSLSERVTRTALRRLVYPVKNLRRRLAGTPYEPPPLWNLSVHHELDAGPTHVIDLRVDPHQASIALATSGVEPEPDAAATPVGGR